MSTRLEHRYDFVYLFDVTDGNPNGDPDAGNMPRVDVETNQGLVTDVCLKRKVRNYVAEVHGMEPPYDIYIRERAVLNALHEKAYKATQQQSQPKRLPSDEERSRALADWMCANFYDIRTFGAVMSTEINCGQVRGPVQLTFARSIDPIFAAEAAITRCAVTHERDLEKERTMGRKFTVPYALYRCHGYISAALAAKSGFDLGDLELLKNALNGMFDLDRSASRGQMGPVRCIAFRHDNRLGNARADELFACVRVELRPTLKNQSRPARSHADYEIWLEGDLPEGVAVEEWVRPRVERAASRAPRSPSGPGVPL